MEKRTLSPELLARMDAYWRAANYISVGQIYLYDNPLLKRPLALADVKHMLLGHWGTTPGQNFIYAHLNRVIKKYDLDMIYVSGPGHGGPAVVGNTYLEGTYSEVYPDISQDEAGLQKLFRQFSFPGGIPSHASPECPGSIHEGGELGYSLSHSFGAVFDNPDLDRRLRRRRRRGGNRTAGHVVAFQQVPRSGDRRRGAAGPAPQRLQDFQPDRPRAHHPRGTGAVAPRLRVDALLRRGPRARVDARGHGRRRSTPPWTDQANPAQRPRRRRPHAAALADDRAQFAERLDGAEGGRWPADRRDVPSAPGAALRPGHPSRAPQAVGGLAEELPAGGALRRAGPPEAGTGRTRAQGRTAHGREPSRQRRHPAPRPEDAGLPRVRGRRARARSARHRRHACARTFPARRGEAQQ